MKNLATYISTVLFLISIVILGGCGGTSSSTSTPPSSVAGKTSLDITDAPASDYSHVYVTVTGVAFHVNANSGFSDYSSAKNNGWQITRLATPQTVDLAQLVNGKTFADKNGGAALFSGITLPNGNYGQIRIFLASTDDALTASASSLGLTYNNEVQLNGDTSHYPLHIPTPEEGIRLIPESPVTVTDTSDVKLVLDFNLNNDIVETSPNGNIEFILKPRLGYFDMSSVGAITGTVAFNNLSTSHIVVKAEQIKSGANYRITRRFTSPDKTSGAFALYPLPVFGNATTATYDVLIRGRNMDTAIIKNITVHKGTTPLSGSAGLGTITMQADQEFTAQMLSPMKPTGAWINFYQTISNDSAAYEVRYRHLDPYTGKFFTPEPLSTGPIQVATYTPGQTLAFAPDSTSKGVFSAVADAAGAYTRGAALTGVTGAAGAAVTMNFTGSELPQASTWNQITALFEMSLLGTGMGNGMGKQHNPSVVYPTKGQIFITHGGMIVDSQGTLTQDTVVPNAMHAGGGVNNEVTISMPGGANGDIYGVYALGWGNGVLAAGTAHGVNLVNGNATATIRMK